MATRKSGKDLRKDYRALLDKTKAMQKRIVKRAEELIPQYPEVVYIEKNFPDGKPLTVGEYKRCYRIDVQIALSIIEMIEQYIADQHPHQQQDLFPGHKTSENAVRIANPETKDKRDV